MKIGKPGFIVMVLWFGFSQSVYAQTDSEQRGQHCSKSIVSLVGTHLGIADFVYPEYENQDKSSGLVAGVCKVWPYDKSKTIAAFSYGYIHTPETEQVNLVVALIDTHKNVIDAISNFEGFLQGVDAAYHKASSLGIDTARYDLAPGIRAFGIDNWSENPYSRLHEGGSGAERTLFVKDGKKIKSIFNITLSKWHYVHDGYCNNEVAATDKIEIDRSEFTIGMSKTITNGYANLIITEVIATTDCAGTILKKKSSQHEVAYDGKGYH
jgi:hypothetical protein